ncbi:MAG: protein kinase [Candidatus Sericytochromatia bacterium]|nr:protein kinase [Candidatus Sericytochromatia bacterium]
MNILSRNYEIIKEIGRGGMGIVFLAHDKRLDRKVAVKVLQMDPNLEREDSERTVQRFYKEGQSLAKLTHPNIVGIYDIGEESGEYYMIMEFIEGKSLARLLQIKSNFTVDLVLSIGKQISEALEYIHEKGILHRDIKPGNIMLSELGVAKLTDFGLAKLNSSQYAITQTGSLFGSLMYIPPEQALGQKTLDHRADIYSLGITLYELLTGASPFMDDTIAIVVKKVIDEEPNPPSSIIPDIPPELDRIILKSVRKDPAERYQHVLEMAKDINELIESRALRISSLSQEQLGNAGVLSFSGKSEDNLLLSSIIQFLSLNNSSGRLSFRLNKELQGSIYIYEGNLTHAELGKLTGLDAISHMFCWKYSRGEFEFDMEYQGEKLFYKSLDNVSVQQMLKVVNERLESCLHRRFLHEQLGHINKNVTIITEEVSAKILETKGPRKKMLEKLMEKNQLPVGELISNTLNSEFESCGVLEELIDTGLIAPFSNLDKLVPYSHLLHAVNIISKYTDKSIALKFVSDKKSQLNLSNTNSVSLKQLYRLANISFKEFNSLLPEKKSRWDNMKQQLKSYVENLANENI